jgi:hypothetical protein
VCHPPKPNDFRKCPAPSASNSSDASGHTRPHPHLLPRCDCPDCDARGSHHIDFCINSQSSTEGGYGYGYSDESAAQQRDGGYSSQEGGYENSNTYTRGDSEGSSQQTRSSQHASYIFNPIAYVVAGSAAVLIVGAILFRKRVSQVTRYSGNMRSTV